MVNFSFRMSPKFILGFQGMFQRVSPNGPAPLLAGLFCQLLNSVLIECKIKKTKCRNIREDSLRLIKDAKLIMSGTNLGILPIQIRPKS
jgi:hypothetical protein